MTCSASSLHNSSVLKLIPSEDLGDINEDFTTSNENESANLFVLVQIKHCRFSESAFDLTRSYYHIKLCPVSDYGHFCVG